MYRPALIHLFDVLVARQVLSSQNEALAVLQKPAIVASHAVTALAALPLARYIPFTGDDSPYLFRAKGLP